MQLQLARNLEILTISKIVLAGLPAKSEFNNNRRRATQARLEAEYWEATSSELLCDKSELQSHHSIEFYWFK